jgi:uncharacterized protein
MRVFFDTNVIASAYATPGVCRRLFRLCLERHTVLVSSYVLHELKRTLSNKFGVPEVDAIRILASLRSSCTVTNPKPESEKVSRDPKDDPVLAAAAHAKADYLVTGDKDLLVLACYRNIPIVAPGLLQMIDPSFEE